MRINRAAPGVLVAAVCALTIAGCGGSQAQGGSQALSAPSAPAASSATGATAVTAGEAEADATVCTMSQLKVALTNTGALGGQAGGYLRFTNHSRATCRLTGWPVVAGVTANGKATTFRHARSTMYGAWRYSAPLPVLTLRPGDSGYAVVEADDLPVGTATSCPAADVRLRVAVPGGKSSVLLSAWLPGALTYLPTCRSVTGSETAQTSAITTLSRLAH
jgi:hypothetical protein